jgi:four helix bundle protein
MRETRKTAQNFQDLIVWQKAHQFVLRVYTLTKEFPQAEIFGLTSQLRRAAVSVAANIAEGFKRKGTREKARYFNIAQASLEESRYYLLLSDDLGYCSSSDAMSGVQEVSKLLQAYSGCILNSQP